MCKRNFRFHPPITLRGVQYLSFLSKKGNAISRLIRMCGDRTHTHTHDLPDIYRILCELRLWEMYK